MPSSKLAVGFLLILFSMGATAQTAATKITVIGKLTRVMAIGGESTGWAVEFDTETNVQNKPLRSIEVKFSDPQQAEKYANKRVKITGVVTHRHGLETGDAPMLAVTSIKALKPTS